MKQTLLLIVFAFSTVFGFSQVNDVSINDVQLVSIADLTACTDLSSYDGDTVRVRGIALHDGNLTEVASGSVTGGCRPGIHLLDTANNGLGGDFAGIQIHGVEAADNSNPVTDLHTIFAGDVVEVVGVVGTYAGETQIYPLGNSDVTIITSIAAPAPRVVSVGDLNDGNRVNQLPTGEPVEGSLVMLNNVTVTAVNFFSGGSRVSIDVTDANGNTINVSDRFLVQRLPSYTSVNPSAPAANGSFVAPPVGLVYDTLIGIVLHSENGCTGGAGRGYEINPFDLSHYIIGVTPPSIVNVMRIPTAPKSTDSPVINSEIEDFDGSVASVYLHYTNNITAGNFDSVAMTLVGGQAEYSGTIPAMAEGDMVGYFIRAEDNDGNMSQYPATPGGAATNNLKVYTVRDNGLTIVDIQKVLDYNKNDSYYTGDTVTLTGVVSASAKDYDLGYVYIQQMGATEWGGLSLIGNSDLVLLKRTEEVTVTGVIEENYNFTRMNVIDVVKTGNIFPLETTYFDPSDAALHSTGEIEKYESMTVGFANGTSGLFMTNENAGFGDYEVGSSATATQSTMVTAGRQSGSAFTSLWVSLVTDIYYWDNDGQMEVDTVITSADMEMDSIAGILYFGFGNYKLMPRNNDDIIGLSENGTAIVLDTTNYNYPDTVTSVINVEGVSIETIIYPNPASDQVSVSVDGVNNFTVAVYDLSGRMVSQSVRGSIATQVSVANLQNGVYLMKVTDLEGNHLAIDKIVVKH